MGRSPQGRERAQKMFEFFLFFCKMFVRPYVVSSCRRGDWYSRLDDDVDRMLR